MPLHLLPRQILIELHDAPAPPHKPQAAYDFFDSLFKLGYVATHLEPNTQYAAGGCVEYVFVRLSPKFCYESLEQHDAAGGATGREQLMALGLLKGKQAGAEDLGEDSPLAPPGAHVAVTKSGIPKIVHQSYKSHALPLKFHFWREQCKQMNPDWEFRVWTDHDNRELIKRYYDWFLPV